MYFQYEMMKMFSASETMGLLANQFAKATAMALQLRRRCCGTPRRVVITSICVTTAVLLMGYLPGDDLAGDMSFVIRWANTTGQACLHPVLKVWPKSMKAHYAKVPWPLRCASAGPNWVFVVNGTFRISAQARMSHGRITCVYTPLLRLPDDVTVVEGAKLSDMRDGWPITSDFFKANCRASDGSVRDHLISGIAYKDQVHKRRPAPGQPDPAALPLNVLMFGFDSTSHMSWMRMLPRTHRYFTEALGGVVLDAYNIVGDGTPQALLPILTGLNEMELPEARRGHSGANRVDGHPWVWKRFREAGYATQWGEDGAEYGTFQYRMLGFKEQPVDHYMRPFYLEAERQYNRHYPYCLGSLPRHLNMLNWVRQFFDMYPHMPKFSLLFHSELSHDGLNDLQLADKDTEAFLRAMNASGYLDNTLLILMADHGARFSSARQSVQGKFEERMPYMGFRFPACFERKYSEVMRNLRTNVHRLTTPYDIHATFLDILKYDSSVNQGDIRQRGISLLKEIPRERTCVDAGIDAHWCVCLAWEAVSTDDTNVKAAANAIVRLINELTGIKRHLCRSLALDYVTSAVRYSPSDRILRYRGSKDDDGRIADLSGSMSVTNVLYQLMLVMSPGGGVFEATVKHDVNRNQFSANVKEISRINTYGQQPHCVADELPHLRQFCYCRSQIQ